MRGTANLTLMLHYRSSSTCRSKGLSPFPLSQLTLLLDFSGSPAGVYCWRE
jgi:hypothetical protein